MVKVAVVILVLPVQVLAYGKGAKSKKSSLITEEKPPIQIKFDGCAGIIRAFVQIVVKMAALFKDGPSVRVRLTIKVCTSPLAVRESVDLCLERSPVDDMPVLRAFVA